MSENHLPLLSRLIPPLAMSHEIQRAQVCDQIFSAGGAKVVLICAPAGFGKSTVMRQVRERCERSGLANAWLNLDQSDNDIARLLRGIASSLESIMPGISTENSSERNDATGSNAIAILERIALHGEPFILFLDDFESLHSGSVLSLLRQLIQTLPAGAQLVIGSRIMPDLGLGRLRATGRLLEIDTAQLRFTIDEASDFLHSGRRLQIPAEDIGRLHARTEGWAAALWLASLALAERERSMQARSGESAAEFIHRFSGSDSAIADYLAEDVLSHQSPELRRFLLQTSILSTLTAESCDAILGRQDSGDLLELLERANLFVVSLDNQRRAYRYHGLFREFLRAQLGRELPDEVFRINRAASDWYLEQKRPVLAIDHALLAGNIEHALHLLAAEAPRLLESARMRLLARWLGSVPMELLKEYPALRIIHAWAVNFTSGPMDAMRLVEAIDQIERLDDDSLAHFFALKLLLLLRLDRIDEAYRIGLTHLRELPIQVGFARSMFANALGTASMMLGRFPEAQEFLVEARRVQTPVGGSFSVVLSESVEGAMDLLRGHLRQAVSRLRGAVQPRVDGAARYSKANALAGVLLAEALYELDERAESERLLTGYLPLIQEGGLPDQLISGHILLARLLALRGDRDQAFHVIMELEYLGHLQQLKRVSVSARLARAQLALDAGNINAAGEELHAAEDEEVWAQARDQFMVANDTQTYEIVQLRWLVRSGRAVDAIDRLKELLAEAKKAHRVRRVLKLQILLAEALHRAGQEKVGLRQLIKALSFGQSEGFIRSIVDEGEITLLQIQELLNSGMATSDGLSRTYLQQILASAGQESGAEVDAREQMETLTRREIAVLELVAEGLSNRALAQRFYLSETTIRTHMRNINAKLGVHSRVQALVEAKRRGYIK